MIPDITDYKPVLCKRNKIVTSNVSFLLHFPAPKNTGTAVVKSATMSHDFERGLSLTDDGIILNDNIYLLSDYSIIVRVDGLFVSQTNISQFRFCDNWIWKMNSGKVLLIYDRVKLFGLENDVNSPEFTTYFVVEALMNSF